MDVLTIAQAQLKDLIPRVWYYRDTAQWAKARDCWHPDSSQTRIKTSWFDGTVDGWIAGQTKIVETSTMHSSHLVQPIEATVDETGTKGLLLSVGNVSIRLVVEGVEVDVVSWCRFVNRAMKVDGVGWRLVSFEAIYDRDSVVAANGVSLSEGLMRTPEGARDSYKYVEWVLSRRGMDISRDLPGTDRPETVEKVMTEADAWLYGK